MKNKIFAIVCCVLLQNCIEAQDPCRTLDGQTGRCIQLRKCAHLYRLLATKPLTDEIRVHLARSQCGYRNESPFVCCAMNAPPVTPPPWTNTYSGASGLTEADMPPPGQCGSQTDNRIFGGNVTGISQHPWMAMLEYSKPDGSRGFHCGGALIHPSYVLTASHCVNGKEIVQARYHLVSVRLGEWDTTTENDCDDDDVCSETPQDIPVSELIPHENYQPYAQVQQDDIALLRLQRPAQITDYIRMICLPFGASARNRNYDGSPLSLVGFGKTETASRSNIKLYANVDGVSLDECNRVYSTLNVRVGSKQVCAGGQKGIDSCNGDSGGPLLAKDKSDLTNSIFYLAGVVSFGPKQCGLEGWPGVYTRTSAYTDWILSHMRPT